MSSSRRSPPSTGPSGSRRCSGTGSGDLKGPSSTWRWKVVTGRTAVRMTIRVFTTRPDTLFGMTYAVVAPEHPLVDQLTLDEHRAEVDELRERAARSSELERTSAEVGPGSEKRGAFTGSQVINPFTGQPVPVYVADYVLMGYGTGAIMAVPAEDQRDWDFAQLHRLPIVRTVEPPAGWDDSGGAAYSGDGPKINSGFLDGLAVIDAKAKAIERLEELGIGSRQVNYRFATGSVRASVWGCPIPIVYCSDHGPVPVPEDELPVLAPDDVEFLPTGQSPLASHAGFLHTTCPGLRRPGHPRNRHHGHVCRLELVLPPVLRPVQRGRAVRSGGRRSLDAGRPLHRRDRARHPASALRPVLHACAGRRRARAGAGPRPFTTYSPRA